MVEKIESVAAAAFDLFKPGFAAKVVADYSSRQVEGAAKSADLTAAGTILRYKDLGVGEFSGLPAVTWNGFYPDKRPKFVFVTNRKKPFSFTDSTNRKFRPGLMDTDGGSIPAILHGVMEFSPWGYGVGYIVHDWLFVAHKCKSKPDDDVTFEDSARILGEAVKTVMEVGFEDFDGRKVKFPRNEGVAMAIYTAVSGSIARKLWDDASTVNCRPSLA